MNRKNGTGPLRVGTSLTFSEDIYSIFFCTCMKTEYIFFSKKNYNEDDEKREKKERSFRQKYKEQGRSNFKIECEEEI